MTVLDSKFDSEEAASLYGETPDEQAFTETTWNGLFIVERTILTETNSSGKVVSIVYDSTDELLAAWDEIVEFCEN